MLQFAILNCNFSTVFMVELPPKRIIFFRLGLESMENKPSWQKYHNSFRQHNFMKIVLFQSEKLRARWLMWHFSEPKLHTRFVYSLFFFHSLFLYLVWFKDISSNNKMITSMDISCPYSNWCYLKYWA